MYRVKDKVKLQNLLDMEDLVDTLVIAVSDPIYLYKEGASLEECRQNIYVTDSAPANKTYSLSGIKNIASTATSYLTLPHFDSYEEKVSGVSAFKIIKEIKKDEISMNDNFADVPWMQRCLKDCRETRPFCLTIQKTLPHTTLNMPCPTISVSTG